MTDTNIVPVRRSTRRSNKTKRPYGVGDIVGLEREVSSFLLF